MCFILHCNVRLVNSIEISLIGVKSCQRYSAKNCEVALIHIIIINRRKKILDPHMRIRIPQKNIV